MSSISDSPRASAATDVLVDIEPDDVGARLGERDRERQADVAEPDDPNLHSISLSLERRLCAQPGSDAISRPGWVGAGVERRERREDPTLIASVASFGAADRHQGHAQFARGDRKSKCGPIQADCHGCIGTALFERLFHGLEGIRNGVRRKDAGLNPTLA